MSPWLCLEALPGLVAVESVWQRMIGEQFAAFRTLCLQPAAWQVRNFPCPRNCGCDHAILDRHDGTGAIGVCRCATPACPDIPLTLRDITPLEVNRARLGQALCRAFGLTPRHTGLFPPNTLQFGAWSADAVPAILTIQVQNSVFRRVVAELAAELRQPFILFAPTSDFLDAPCRGILENHGAAFFALDTRVILADNGTLQATTAPGELFARFTPQPKELDVDAAARAFALVVNLDTEKPLPHPSLLTVFRRYCVESLSAAQSAHRCQCSKPTILRRLAVIHARTGVDPKELRRLSPHIAKLEASLADSRAARIRRQRADSDDH